MTREPTEKEIKEAVFNLNKENTCGPNGFSEELVQTCQEIIKKDISLMVMIIFSVVMKYQYNSHTNVVLYLEKVSKYLDLRPHQLELFC